MNQKTGCRKWLVVGSWLLVGFLLLIAITVAGNWKQCQLIVPMFADMMANPEYGTGLNTAEDLLAYAEAHPETVAIVVYSVAEDGSPIQDETAVWHNADEAMPLASTKKIFVLAAYAHAVAEGRLDPQTQIAVGSWDHYHLPGTNCKGSDIAALNDLGIEVDGKEKGWNGPGLKFDRDGRRRRGGLATTPRLITWSICWAQEAIAENDALGRAGCGSAVSPTRAFALTWQKREQTALTAESLAEMTALEEAEYARRVLAMM